MKNRPPYAIESVDHALRLAQLLQQEGALRVTEAATRLGVSVSTAHRLLAMLVYRDFAEQAPDRSYRPGPALQQAESGAASAARLWRIAMPHLHQLVAEVNESANLVVLVGRQVRFIASVECSNLLRVGDRAGRMMPAHVTSGGKAILASLAPAELAALYASTGVDIPRLRRVLAVVRRRGFAVNDQETELGVTAIGIAICNQAERVVAAVSVALPTVRYARQSIPTWVGPLRATATAMTAELDFDF